MHLLAAAVWTGGLLTLGALVPALRKAGAGRPMLQAVARRFGHVSWTAFGILVVTGIWQVDRIDLPWDYGRLVLKLVLVGATGAAALVHQLTARRSSPAARAALQGLILLLSIAVFGAAVRLL